MTRLRKIIVLAALATAAVAPATAQAQAGVETPTEHALYQDGQRGRFMLDGTWYFRADPAGAGQRGGFARQTSLAGWSPVTVPNAWNASDVSDISDRGSIGWYRKDFNLPGGGASAWILRFESVNYRATVFLNGRQVGYHEGAFVPFEVPARSIRHGVNHLVIKVDSRRRPADIPPATDQSNGRPGGGWWNYGGLLREVYLRRVRGVDIQNLLVRPTLRTPRSSARIMVRATLANPSGGTKNVNVHANVAGHNAHFRSVKVGRGRTATATAFVTLRHPHLWSPNDPFLYTAKVRASGGEYDTHFGVRKISVNRQGQMLLNGHRVELRGASMHEYTLAHGQALTADDLRMYVGLLQGLHANFTRSHYPLNEYTLEQCDRLGIMVWEQIPYNRERFGNTATSLASVDDLFARSRRARAKALEYERTAIRRDQNHASVFAWSVANEPDPKPGGAETAYFNAARKLVHSMDPTRLAAVDLAGYPSMRQSDLYGSFDAIGLNSYFGWYPGPSGELDDRTQLRPFLNQQHGYYPHSALFVTEFGAEANRDGPVDEKGTYNFQDAFLNYHLDVYDNDPFINGAAVWILHDFAVQPGWAGGNPIPTSPWLSKGLVGLDDKPKPAYGDVAQRFADTPPLR